VIHEFEQVANVADLPAGSLRTVQTRRGQRVCLIHREDGILAISAVCSHKHFPLAEGTLLPGDRLQCAWHGAQFDLHTGAALHGPAVDAIPIYEVEVRDGVVFVRDRQP